MRRVARARDACIAAEAHAPRLRHHRRRRARRELAHRGVDGPADPRGFNGGRRAGVEVARRRAAVLRRSR